MDSIRGASEAKQAQLQRESQFWPQVCKGLVGLSVFCQRFFFCNDAGLFYINEFWVHVTCVLTSLEGSRARGPTYGFPRSGQKKSGEKPSPKGKGAWVGGVNVCVVCFR